MPDDDSEVRSAVVGADRAFQVIRGGGGRGGGDEPPRGPDHDGDDRCPVIGLGHLDGTFHFLDSVGQRRSLTAAQFGRRTDILALFGGHAEWLRAKYPFRRSVKETDKDGQETTKTVIFDFALKPVGEFLMKQCFVAGLFGDHVRIRKPGIWVSASGLPVIHAGDGVQIDGKWYPPGHRTDNSVWAAAPAVPRPLTPCDASIGRQFQTDMQRLWNFKLSGGAIAILGLVGSGYFGAAAPWRPNGFILGGQGCGKSQLLGLACALSPINFHTNDTTKAGLEQNVAGRAMPCYIDEAGVSVDAKAAQGLLNLVLAASGGEGTRGSRGGSDGRGRTIELIGCILMAATHPPDMQPQHMARFVLVDLLGPAKGEDYALEHAAIIQRATAIAPRLWGRALGAFERYMQSRDKFRAALLELGCLPREMDQVGAILAGWWILTEEGVPDAKQARGGVIALDGFIRIASTVQDDDAPRRVVQHLLSSMVQLSRSTDRDQVGTLLEIAWNDPDPDSYDQDRRPESAKKVLHNYGLRPIGARDDVDRRSKQPFPRGGVGDGVWIAYRVTGLTELFRGTPYEGSRWLFELKRMDSAIESKRNIRVGGYSGPCLWLSRVDLYPVVEEDAA